jgi:hypothetical protein
VQGAWAPRGSSVTGVGTRWGARAARLRLGVEALSRKKLT